MNLTVGAKFKSKLPNNGAKVFLKSYFRFYEHKISRNVHTLQGVPHLAYFNVKFALFEKGTKFEKNLPPYI